MIMARNEDGTYSQVGFVKDNAGIDTEYIYDKDGDIVFEKGFTRETSGTVPLTINGIGKDLKAWSITGNTVQNGTPTPENPVEVQAVGDRTGNLFDNSLLEQGGWKATAGTIPTKLLPDETNYTCRTRYNQIIPLLASTLSLYCPANIKINYVWIDANGISLGGSGFQKNGDTATAPEQAVSMTFILGLDSDIECTPSDFSDINLVAGSIAPESYEPYGYKIPVVTRGKNLAGNYTVSSGYYYDDSGTPTSSDARFIRLIINVEPNTIYTISSNLKFYSIWEFNNNTKISRRGGNNSNKYTIKTTKECNSLRISMINTSGEADTSAFEWIQLEEGSTATPYEPYHEPITTPIYLDKPLYKIGDYADTLCYAEQKAERYIKELILTGEENITSHSVINDIVGVRIPTPATVAAASPAICTHAINVTWANFYASRTYAKVATNVGGGNSIVYMSAPDSEHNTLSGIKDYLATQYANGTPVTVYYILAEPETESITLPEIPTLNGTTVIDVDTAVKPTEMYTKYKSSK